MQQGVNYDDYITLSPEIDSMTAERKYLPTSSLQKKPLAHSPILRLYSYSLYTNTSIICVLT